MSGKDLRALRRVSTANFFALSTVGNARRAVNSVDNFHPIDEKIDASPTIDACINRFYSQFIHPLIHAPEQQTHCTKSRAGSGFAAKGNIKAGPVFFPRPARLQKRKRPALLTGERARYNLVLALSYWYWRESSRAEAFIAEVCLMIPSRSARIRARIPAFCLLVSWPTSERIPTDSPALL